MRFFFENKDIVKHCNWFMSSPTIPRAIMVNLTDGARQSLTIANIELVSCILRLLNNEEVSRSPKVQLILALEQSHESTELFDLILEHCNINEALQLLEKHGVDVICIGDESCTLCAKEFKKRKKCVYPCLKAFFHA